MLKVDKVKDDQIGGYFFLGRDAMSYMLCHEQNDHLP